MTRRPLPVFVLAVALASTLSAIGTAGPACAEDSAVPSILVDKRRAADRIGVGEAGEKATILIRSARGIGRAVLFRGKRAWPGAVTVRLESFREIEHFHVTAGATTLICELERREAAPAEQVCRLDGEPAEPPVVAGVDIDIALPPALFASNPEELAVDWIDHFR